MEEFLANKRTKLYQCIWGMMLDSNIVLLKKGIFSIIRYIFPGEEDEAEEEIKPPPLMTGSRKTDPVNQ